MKLAIVYPNFPFWRAEVSRLALHLGGIPFDNVHPSREDWAAMRASGELTFGQVPILRVDGQVIAQTGAIARFCGKLSGHYPDDPLLAAKVDQVIDAATDITGTLSPTMREKDPETKLAMRQKIAAETLPKWLGYLERLLGQNPVGPYFVGETLTIADLAIWRLVGWLTGGILDGVPTTLLEPFSSLSAHFKTVDEIPEIRRWMHDQYGS